MHLVHPFFRASLVTLLLEKGESSLTRLSERDSPGVVYRSGELDKNGRR